MFKDVTKYSHKQTDTGRENLRDRWHMISDDCVWMFPVEVTLSTVEMPAGWIDDFGYQYESCLFRHHDSEVLERYTTKESAIQGHIKYAEKYKLKNERMK